MTPAPTPSTTAPPFSDRRRVALWVGTYPVDGPDVGVGTGEGVWRVDVHARTGAFEELRQIAEIPSPSFLALHPSGRTLYSVTEASDGVVEAFGLDAAAADLEPHPDASLTTHGAYPCHVLATDDAVWVANYGSGSVSRLPVDDGGAFAGATRTDRHTGSGPREDRQEGPHAHFVGRVDDEVWSADLGTDRLVRYAPDGTVVGEVALPAGSGPRHFVTVPGAVLVVCELDPCVLVVSLGDEAAAEPAVVARYDVVDGAPGPAGGQELPVQPSHVALSADGARLYVAVRGPDVLVAFEVVPAPGGGQDAGPRDQAPTLRRLAQTPVGGAWPRHFAVVGALGDELDGADPAADLVVVANQVSGTLASLRVARDSGRAELLSTARVPSPACVLPA
ncbi:beta-propeller fold lactonase family protein [Cellulomonas sp. PhB143]|uniref:lactonase family protein n=1 Tax=Cellulomonas sp. PhB143 TaxID=2485186 RepID=UPI000F49495F|nr:beta-propeller fold lactonase family protein [Cellulomonas sp. PhB143]ROS78810.1 6-phosphogluconolactonase (cycloisomerase 2 family) [Cellulomonas sp. PhB143]